jgi:transcriptional regulator of heat shock response
MLQKAGEDQVDRMCEKQIITQSEEARNIVHTIKRRKENRIGHILSRNCRLTPITEGKIEGEIKVIRRQRRRCKQLLDYLTETRGYWKLKEEALHRTVCRTRFGRDCRPVVRETAE